MFVSDVAVCVKPPLSMPTRLLCNVFMSVSFAAIHNDAICVPFRTQTANNMSQHPDQQTKFMQVVAPSISIMPGYVACAHIAAADGFRLIIHS